MAEPSRSGVVHELAECRHCSAAIERRGGWWTHKRSKVERCAPGSRNAQMADPTPHTVQVQP
jgi:hypothetical protein